MGLSPPFDRDGKVICSQQYDFGILGVVEKWGISYSPKMIHSGNVNGQNDDEPEKHVGNYSSKTGVQLWRAPSGNLLHSENASPYG